MVKTTNWTTQYPTNLDTETQLPDLEGGNDYVMVSQIHSLRDILQELEALVGSNNLEATSLRKKISVLETVDIPVLAQNTNMTAGNNVVDSIDNENAQSLHWDYVIADSTGNNKRAGKIMAVWGVVSESMEIQYSETKTDDIGSTTGVSLSVDFSSPNIRLMCTVSSGTWSIYVKRDSTLG
jgi:hypothetical protein